MHLFLFAKSLTTLFTKKPFSKEFLVEQIQPKGPQSKEGNNRSENEGRFEVLVEIDGKDWRLGITFDHIENEAHYYTVKPSGTGAGRTSGWKKLSTSSPTISITRCTS